jgi:hypothetical protein
MGSGPSLDRTQAQAIWEMSAEKLHQVQYTDNRPQFYFADCREQDRDDNRFRHSVIASLTTKAAQWAYEKEWRCIDFVAAGERPMPNDMLNGIVFGCRTSDADKQMVREWVQSTQVDRSHFIKRLNAMDNSHWTSK